MDVGNLELLACLPELLQELSGPGMFGLELEDPFEHLDGFLLATGLSVGKCKRKVCFGIVGGQGHAALQTGSGL